MAGHYVGSVSQSDAMKITTKMAAHMGCCVHVVIEEDGPILQTSDKTLQKIKDSAEKWRYLDGVESEIAEKYCSSAVEYTAGYKCADGNHMACYRKFTDITKINRAIKRCAKLVQPIPERCADEITPRKSTRQVENLQLLDIL